MKTHELKIHFFDDEYQLIAAYVKAKKRWRYVAHFARDAIFQAMDRNPVGKRGAVLHQPDEAEK